MLVAAVGAAFLGQSISLLGDAFTWVGLTLLSYQFGKAQSAIILATALTLRVTAFILFKTQQSINLSQNCIT
jgi:hypothetical protein